MGCEHSYGRSIVERVATGSRRGAWSLLGASAALVLAASDAAAGACTKTTSAALRACRSDARDNFQIATGVCLNVSDPAEREQCLNDADDQRDEDRLLCREQRIARGELCRALGEARYDPDFDPANFVDPLEIGDGVEPNPYFPLVQGYQWLYESEEETITVTVTDQTKAIEDVTCVVVTDLVEQDGVPIESTVDWYAQDLDGNVWYCGEIAQNFELFEDDVPALAELVDIDGSWKTGREGAKPGIIMFANPQVGDIYRQEFALGDAEDAAEVTSTSGTAAVAAASCDNDCVVTRDFTPLEPDAEETKFYARDVGLILEEDPETGERTELVGFNTPPGP